MMTNDTRNHKAKPGAGFLLKTTIYLRQDQVDGLDNLAAKYGSVRAELIRRAVDRLLVDETLAFDCHSSTSFCPDT